MLRPHKLAPQSVPCIYLGKTRDQPGHMCFNPVAKRIYISPHAQFIETEFPGLTAATIAQTHEPAQTHQPPDPPPLPPANYDGEMDDDMADGETRANADNTTSNDDYTEADEGTIATRILRRRRAPAA
eukprot:4043778-Pleurochrysis_carterae.AAC.1